MPGPGRGRHNSISVTDSVRATLTHCGGPRLIIHPSGQFDNHATAYEHIDALPLSAAMGAEIRGVTIAATTDEQFAEIEAALFRHKMIFFRDQDITHADHEAFSSRFGPFAEDAYTKGVDGHENVQPVIKEADSEVAMIFGSGWHTDSPFLPQPPAISMLYGVDIPPFGGDTMWANSALAFSMLSDRMQRTIEPFRVHMSMKNVVALAQASMAPRRVGDRPNRGDQERPTPRGYEAQGRREFPPAGAHASPAPGEKGLYCDGTYAVGIEGHVRSRVRSRSWSFLVAHITQPAFTCRLRWAPEHVRDVGQPALCVHQAFNDHDGFRRELYRTTITGESPR